MSGALNCARYAESHGPCAGPLLAPTTPNMSLPPHELYTCIEPCDFHNPLELQDGTLNMCLRDHSELIATMTEFYALLDALAAINPNSLYVPLADIGVHPPSLFNANAAREGGFDEEAVLVLSALPYLNYPARIDHSVFARSYLDPSLNEHDFESSRVISGHEILMPSEVVQLTSSEGGYGAEYIYDTKKRLMYPWRQMYDGPSFLFDGTDSNRAYEIAPPKSPREALQPLIDKFRGLKYITRPLAVEEDADHIIYDEDEEFGDIAIPNCGESDRKEFEAARYLQRLYLECGWQVGSVNQTAFRREEFLEKRKRFLRWVDSSLEE